MLFVIRKIQLPHEYGDKRRRIIRSYIKTHPDLRICSSEIVRKVSLDVGYTIDKNKSNDFVRRVIKEYIEFLNNS